MIIALTEAELDVAMGAHATFATTTLPGGSCNGVDEDITVIGIPNVLSVSSDMSNNLAHEITEAMFENIAELQAVHPAGCETTVKFASLATPVPQHPGAIR